MNTNVRIVIKVCFEYELMLIISIALFNRRASKGAAPSW